MKYSNRQDPIFGGRRKPASIKYALCDLMLGEKLFAPMIFVGYNVEVTLRADRKITKSALAAVAQIPYVESIITPAGVEIDRLWEALDQTPERYRS